MTLMTFDVLSAKREAMIPKFSSDHEKARILSQFDSADIDGAVLIGNRVLVAKWIRDREGSIKLVEKTKKEDEYQGKIGLVLMVGPLAFEDDSAIEWRGQRARVGDWVLFHYGDGAEFDYRPVGTYDRIPCKILRENDIAMILPRPDFAY